MSTKVKFLKLGKGKRKWTSLSHYLKKKTSKIQTRCTKGNGSCILFSSEWWQDLKWKKKCNACLEKLPFRKKKDFKRSPGLYYVTQDCRHREMRNCNYWNVEKWPRQCQVHVPYHEPFLLSLHFGPITESQTLCLLGQTWQVEVLGSGCPKVVSLDLLGRVHTGLFTTTRFLFIHSCETV